jgi:hypothetical protein
LVVAPSLCYAHHTKYAFPFFLVFFCFVLVCETRIEEKEEMRKKRRRRKKNKKEGNGKLKKKIMKRKKN